ncbi:MAG: HPr family phosphocarrier protein [Alphaproteobacteria bacterium]|nr:HPr family phosphocarrier protein [Alphaproteobacteria bacterium]
MSDAAPQHGAATQAADGQGGDSISRTVTIVNRRGLHARAAARFVKLAAQFDAQISVTKRDSSVSGLSIMGLMMLAAGPGCEVVLAARGRQREEAIAALVKLIAARFDEEE